MKKSKIFSEKQLEKISKYIESRKKLLSNSKKSFLVHGDFSCDHIYQKDGKYTGIIDFGDIKGATRFYDLGHYYFLDGKKFDSLLGGYSNELELSKEDKETMIMEGLFIAIGKIAWIYKNETNKKRVERIIRRIQSIIT